MTENNIITEKCGDKGTQIPLLQHNGNLKAITRWSWVIIKAQK